MAPIKLAEADELEFYVIVNDELDFISASPSPVVKQVGPFTGGPISTVPEDEDRGGVDKQLNMSNLCCGALGLSLLIVRQHPVRWAR
jgi:7,8-dihydropterin-6-yl-methyl-4-(beta-D-ribofuranosyl)aminobenzene 5'-phosphate synthase